MARKTDPQREASQRGWLRYALASAAVLLLAAMLLVGWARLDLILAASSKFVLDDPTAGGDVSSVRITGAQYAPKQRVLGVFASDFGRSIYLLPLEERRRALLEIDWVRDAAVCRLWPNRLEVRLIERVPVAFLRLPEGASHGGVALVDAEGVILDPPPGARFDLPAVSGIQRDQSQPVRQQRIAAAMRLISELGNLADQLSEIDVSDQENVRVTQQAGQRVVRLQLGKRNYLPRMRNFLRYFEAMQERLPDAAEFDLRLDDRITAVEGSSIGG
jgi:cell division protein FtsQ